MTIRPLIFVAALLAFAALPLLGGVILYERLDPHLHLEWVRDIFAAKDAAAAKIVGPKIVLVGGSTIHFGFEAERISKSLGQPVLNYGSHGALLPYYQLHRVKTVLNPGDIVVIGIEYENFFASRESSIQLRTFAKNFDPTFPIAEGRYFSDAIWVAIRENIVGYPPFTWAASITKSRSLGIPDPDNFTATSPYDAAKVNAWGDQTQKDVAGVNANIRAGVRASLQGPAFAISPISSKLSSTLVEFAKWARERNITVVASWMPRLDNPSLRTAPYRDFFNAVRKTYARAGIEILGQPEDMLFPFEDTLDTINHMNNTGAAEASARLTKLLQDYLASRSHAVAPQ